MIHHSTHTFMFPFNWNIKNDASKELSKIEKFIDLAYWEQYQFKLKIYDNINTYNDYQYFYPAVRDVLNLENQDTLVLCKQYQYTGVNKNSEYIISILDTDDLVLQIEDISVNFYENGIGIFTFHLNNCSETDFNRILKINEYGRRLYPQFLGYEKYLTTDTKNNFLAKSIQLKNIRSNHSEIIEDFSYYDNMEDIDSNGFFHLPHHIQYLLGDKFMGTEKSSDDTVSLTPLLDDRMFVISHVFNDELITELKKFDNKEEYNYQTSTKWYRYLFIDDSNPSCKNSTMLKKQLTEQTYARWIDDHQLYGISRYSFVLLTNDIWFTRNIVYKHIKTIYFEMVMLCLLQRAYVIYFGNEIARISTHIKNEHTDSAKARADISSLYLEYLKFVNRVYFREITPQEQGIELYDMLQKYLRIDLHTKALEQEFEELNQLSDILKTNETSKKNKLLQQLSAFLAVPAFILTLTNHSLFKDQNTIAAFKSWEQWTPVFLLLTIFVCSVLVYRAVTNSNNKKKVWESIIPALLIFIAYLFVFQNPFQ